MRRRSSSKRRPSLEKRNRSGDDVINCPDCGTEIRDNAKFCDTCGARIEQGVAQAPPNEASDASEAQGLSLSWADEDSQIDSAPVEDAGESDSPAEPEPEFDSMESDGQALDEWTGGEGEAATEKPPEEPPKTCYLIFPDNTERPLSPSQWLIGRTDLAKFLPDPGKSNEISRGHLTVFQEGDKYFVEDGTTMVQRKRSTNKTWLVRGSSRILVTGNGRNELQDADEIDVAELVKLQFVLKSASGAYDPPPSLYPERSEGSVPGCEQVDRRRNVDGLCRQVQPRTGRRREGSERAGSGAGGREAPDRSRHPEGPRLARPSAGGAVRGRRHQLGPFLPRRGEARRRHAVGTLPRQGGRCGHGDPIRPPTAGGPRLPARAERHPPGCQAEQHHPRCQPRSRPDRLRGGEEGIPPVHGIRDRHLHAGLGGPGAEPGRGHPGERPVRRGRGVLLPPDRTGSPRLHETARGREDGTLPIPPRHRSPRHAGAFRRRDEGYGLRSETTVSDRPRHGRGDRRRV